MIKDGRMILFGDWFGSEFEDEEKRIKAKLDKCSGMKAL